MAWGRGFCSYKDFSQEFVNKLLPVLKSWEGGEFICCLACFHEKKLMCSDICFLRLPAFKEFFDLDKAVRGEEPYLLCSYSTLDGTGNKCSLLQLRFPLCSCITEGSWAFSVLHSVSTKFFDTSFFIGQEKVCMWLEFLHICVCDPAAAPARAALSSWVFIAQQKLGQNMVSLCAGVLLGGKFSVFKVSVCLNEY